MMAEGLLSRFDGSEEGNQHTHKKEKFTLKNSLLIKLVIMLVTASTLSACLLIPVEGEHRGGYERDRGGDHRGGRHEGR